jgi:hypothetical protein
MALKLYSIFHVNLLYSSIPEWKRKEVIERCLWPLLGLATEHRFPIAIEAPGHTLDIAAQLDPQWVRTLKEAVRSGLVEFAGSGYSQIVAPLVPSSVNEWNLQAGKETYRRLVGTMPLLWYVNEQAYSAGIVEHYVKLGAQGIVMEWNNPRALHPEWNDEYKYYPQVAVGSERNRIKLIWNNSISFQKLQRYAHGDIDREDFLSYLLTHLSETGRYFCLYGNDAEIFDFRPGRFKTEAELAEPVEWTRLARLYRSLRNDPRFQLIFPSDVLKSPPVPSKSYLPLSLESASQPIPVKKQPKYNVTRWAVTGRDSLYVNTLCHRFYQNITGMMERSIAPKALNQLKKSLCFFWSSDFRTHITAERWQAFMTMIENLLRETAGTDESKGAAPKGGGRGTYTPHRPGVVRLDVNGLTGSLYVHPAETNRRSRLSGGDPGEVSRKKGCLQISTPTTQVRFDTRRGLAIESLLFPEVWPAPLVGTIPHGYFDDIALSADWYTGNSVLQRPGKPQVTDLVPVEVEIITGSDEGEGWVGCVATTPTEVGPVTKQFRIYRKRPQIDLDYTFDWGSIPAGSFKTGFVTLIPESYDLTGLFYATHNGGSSLEVFRMHNQTIAQNAPASSVVTASSGLGATEGLLLMGDARKAVALRVDPAICAAMPMIAFRLVQPAFFGRVMFSCGELDETRTEEVQGPLRFCCSITGIGRK